MVQTAILQPTDVPHESLQGIHKFGAQAYHRDGIASVKFKLTDGVAYTETNTINSRSSFDQYLFALWCYNTSFDLANFADGQVTMEITATPTTGTAKVLSYTFHNNDGNTFLPTFRYVSPTGNDSWDGLSPTQGPLNAGPKRTIQAAVRALAAADSAGDAGGHFVFLTAGVHPDQPHALPYPTTTRSWVTVRPMPGLNKSQVVIAATQQSQFRDITRLKFQDLLLFHFQVRSGQVSGAKVWFDDCFMQTAAITGPQRWEHDYDDSYYTRSAMTVVPEGSFNPTMIRCCFITDIGKDGVIDLKGSIFNTTIWNMHLGPTNRPENGVRLISEANDNLVICGLRLYDVDSLQLLYFSSRTTPTATYDNIAIENMLAVLTHSGTVPTTPVSQFYEPNKHVVVRHITIVDQFFKLRTDATAPGTPYTATECEFANCCFYHAAVINSTAIDTDGEMRISTCHYVSGNDANAQWGSSTGDAKFTSAGSPNWDYRPGATSPLLVSGTQSFFDLPPGPKGVGAVTSPHIGAWGDAAGLGFSKAPYAATGPDIFGTMDVDIGNLTMASFGNWSTQVANNIPYLMVEMKWAPTGVSVPVRIFDKFTLMTAPPGSDPTHLFVTQFTVLPDGRCLRLIGRNDTARDYLDFWFICYYGHTGTTQVTWSNLLTPGRITIEGKAFFEWGDGRPLRVGNWFAHGHSMLDRIRLTFTGTHVWTTGGVTQTAPNLAGLPPFPGDVPPPVWCTDQKKTLENEIVARKGTSSAMSKWAEGLDREQFRENPWCYAFSARTGDQERFGTSHMDVAVWAGHTSPGGDRYEKAWFNLMKKHANIVGAWVHPDGSLPDFKSTAYNQLVMDTDGVRVDSKGWNDNPANGQNWFNQKTVHVSRWMTRETVTFERWRSLRQSHYGLVHLCQFYARYLDPGIHQLLKHEIERYLASWPVENRGPTKHGAQNQRARGRGGSAAGMLYELTADARLLTHMQARLDIEWTDYQTAGILNGSKNNGGYSAWMTGIWATGLIIQTQNGFNLGTARQLQAEAMLLACIKRVILCFHEWPASSGQWELPYVNNADGTPVTGRETTSSWLWAFTCLMFAKFQWQARLTAAEQTKLDSIFAYRYTNWVSNAANGTANVWPEQAEFFYFPSPTSKTGTMAPAIQTPTMAAIGTVQNTVDITGIFAGTITTPTMTAAGGLTKTGTMAMSIQTPVLAAQGFIKPPSIIIVGQFAAVIPSLTSTATGKKGRAGTMEATITTPTAAFVGTVTFQAHGETQHVGDGSTTTFEIKFGYLHVSHLSVKVDSVLQAEGDWSVNAAGTHIILGTAPGAVLIQIIRTTPHPEPYITFSARSPITSEDVARSMLQGMYYAEEVEDGS